MRLPNYFTVLADMTSATWNTQAKHEIATVTGAVHMIVIPEITGTLTDTADGASMQLGDELVTTSLIASTQCAGGGGKTFSTGEVWVDSSASVVLTKRSLFEPLDFIITNGYDIGYEITGAALTGGSVTFHVFWEPISSTGSVSAGAGGNL